MFCGHVMCVHLQEPERILRFIAVTSIKQLDDEIETNFQSFCLFISRGLSYRGLSFRDTQWQLTKTQTPGYK